MELEDFGLEAEYSDCILLRKLVSRVRIRSRKLGVYCEKVGRPLEDRGVTRFAVAPAFVLAVSGRPARRAKAAAVEEDIPEAAALPAEADSVRRVLLEDVPPYDEREVL